MTNRVIEKTKGILSEKQRAWLRPIYYLCLNAIVSARQPRITSLPRKVFRSPSLLFRYQFFQAAQIYLQVNRIDGSYLEFGCHEANTFRMALNTLGQHGKPNKISRFWAFDSFAGMPKPEGIDRQKIWRAGMNFTSIEKFHALTRRDSYRVTAVKGFYNESLESLAMPTGQLPALCYIDCDYYSSTMEVLTWLASYLQHGCLLAFDDWDCYFGDDDRGQRRAFREFHQMVSERWCFEKFMKIDSGGMCFICIEREKKGAPFEG